MFSGKLGQSLAVSNADITFSDLRALNRAFGFAARK